MELAKVIRLLKSERDHAYNLFNGKWEEKDSWLKERACGRWLQLEEVISILENDEFAEEMCRIFIKDGDEQNG